MMVWTGWTRAAAGGPRQSAETGNARAETLGPDVGQQTWKPGPGGAEGLTDAKESTQNLFRMKMAGPGGRAGAGLGAGARRVAGRAQGRCARRGRRESVLFIGTQFSILYTFVYSPPGAAAGGRAIRGAVSTITQHGTSADNKGTRLGGGQDNGELSDVSQKHLTILPWNRHPPGIS